MKEDKEPSGYGDAVIRQLERQNRTNNIISACAILIFVLIIGVAAWLFFSQQQPSPAGMKAEKDSGGVTKSTSKSDQDDYTNKDLSKSGASHKGTGEHSSSRTGSPVKKDAGAARVDDRTKQSWCSKGNFYRDQIDTAKKRKDAAQKRYWEASFQPHWSPSYKSTLATAEAEVKKAKENLADAEKQQFDFERDANSKGIPQGWLRCQ